MLNKMRSFFSKQIEEIKTDPDHALQLATASLLIELIQADESVHEIELQQTFRAIQDTFKLSDEEARSLMELAKEKTEHATSLFEFTRELNDNLDADQKYRIIFLMWQVAYADGHIDKYEDHLIRKVSELLYVPHQAFIKAKLAAIE